MEIDLERAHRALLQLGSALEEARNVVQPRPGGNVRVRTEDRTIELPVSWAVAGVVGLIVAAILANVQTPTRARREREEEPLGIG